MGVVTFLACCADMARSETWDGALTGTVQWNTGTNWDTDTAPNGQGAQAIFPNSPSGNMTVQLGAAITVGSIDVTNSSTSNNFSLNNGTGGSLTFDATSGNALFTMGGTNANTNNVTVGASVSLTDTLQFTNNNTAITGSATGTFTGTMTGGGGLIKNGPGGLSLSTVAKAYTGETTVNQGRLRFTSSGQLTGTSAVTVNSGGQLFLDASGGTWAFGPSGASNITINGPGDGATLGAITNRGSGTNTLSNPIILGSDSTIDVNAGTLQLNGAVSGTGNLTKSGTGGLLLATANNYVGTTTINAGRIEVQNATSLSSGNVMVASGGELVFTGASANFTFNNPISISGIGGSNNGAIAALNSAAPTIAAPVTLTGNSQITVAGSSSITYSNASSLTGTDVNLTVQGGAPSGSGTGGTISGAVTLGSGSLTKLQGGTWRLNNPAGNSYSGGTTLGTSGGSNAGRLIVNNTSGSGTGSGDVTIHTGSLGGTGIVTGNVTVNSTGRIGPGESAGLLTVGNVTFESGSFLDIELGGTDFGPPIQYDRLSATGTATVNGGTLNVTLLPGFTPAINDTFHVLTAAGGLTGVQFTPMLPPLMTGQWQTTYTSNYLELKVVNAGGTPGDWNGDGSVNAADYVTWRNDPDNHGGPGGYDTWRQNFGNPPGSGAGLGGSAVPEPASIALVLLGVAAVAGRRRGR
jgi:autotransporter-associated beta strand protein